jgi:PAS domain S-box-containing protein
VRVEYGGEYVIAGYARDLRAVKEAEANAREAAEKTKIMFDAMPLCSNFWLSDGTIADCNDEVVKLFGLKNKQEYIDRFGELSPEYQPDGSPSAETAAVLVAKAFKDGYCRFEWMMQKLNGEPVPTEVFLIRVKHHDSYLVVAYFRDLRAQKEAEAKAREADERAKLMLDATPLAVMTWDKNFQIIDCNHGAVDIYGLSSKKDDMEKFMGLAPKYQPNGTTSVEMMQEKFGKAFNETGHERFEWMHRNGRGKLMPFEITLTRIKYKDEYVLLSYAQNLTELKASIAKMREADERSQLMLEQAPLVVMLWDENLQIIDCNQEALRTFGLSSKTEYIERYQLVAYCMVQRPWYPNGTCFKA